MTTNNTTITVRGAAFTVRESFKDVIAQVVEEAQDSPWRSIQDLLVRLFDTCPQVKTDEVVAMVHAAFPTSKYVDETRRARRVSVDVRKYNKGQLAGQKSEPEVQVMHLDAPAGGRVGAAPDALSVLEELLS